MTQKAEARGSMLEAEEALHRFVQAYVGDVEAAGSVVDAGGDSLLSSQSALALEHAYKILKGTPPSPVRGPLVFARCEEQSQQGG